MTDAIRALFVVAIGITIGTLIGLEFNAVWMGAIIGGVLSGTIASILYVLPRVPGMVRAGRQHFRYRRLKRAREKAIDPEAFTAKMQLRFWKTIRYSLYTLYAAATFSIAYRITLANVATADFAGEVFRAWLIIWVFSLMALFCLLQFSINLTYAMTDVNIQKIGGSSHEKEIRDLQLSVLIPTLLCIPLAVALGMLLLYKMVVGFCKGVAEVAAGIYHCIVNYRDTLEEIQWFIGSFVDVCKVALAYLHYEGLVIVGLYATVGGAVGVLAGSVFVGLGVGLTLSSISLLAIRPWANRFIAALP